MDAEARTGSRVLAHVGPRGARYGDLRKATGLAPEALDAALKALRASRLISSVDGRWYQVGLEPRLTTPARKPVPLAEFRKSRQQQTHERWERLLSLRMRGLSRPEIASEMGLTLSSAKRLMDRAVAWDRRGRP